MLSVMTRYMYDLCMFVPQATKIWVVVCEQGYWFHVCIFRMNSALKLKLKTATKAVVHMALEMFYKMPAHHGMFG